MYCAECGNEVGSQEKFCGKCGHPVRQSFQETSAAPQEQNEAVEVEQTDIEYIPDEESVEREQARRDVIHGSLWFFGGAAVTGVTYLMAAGGGVYFITWGAIVIGGIQLLRGLAAYHNSGGIPAKVRNTGIVVLAVAALAGYFFYQDQQGKLSIFDLKKGDCFSIRGPTVEGEHSAVTIFSCSSTEWDYRLLSSAEVSSSSSKYPGESYFDKQAESKCPSLADTFFFPTSESWAEGDRMIQCVAER